MSRRFALRSTPRLLPDHHRPVRDSRSAFPVLPGGFLARPLALGGLHSASFRGFHPFEVNGKFPGFLLIAFAVAFPEEGFLLFLLQCGVLLLSLRTGQLHFLPEHFLLHAGLFLLERDALKRARFRAHRLVFQIAAACCDNRKQRQDDDFAH